MNLFSRQQKQDVAPMPSIDDAQQRVNDMRKAQGMKGRAANMLSTGEAATTAQRTVTGN